MNSNNLGVSRPPSEQVRDLHVYVIPPELWRQHLRSAANEVIADSISLGFLRIAPHLHLRELREEIVSQLGDDYLPKDYAFLKSVGRCLTQVKARQERELKVKHFLPPYAYSPELFILDAHAESMRDSPSTIFQHSLSGTNLSKPGSKDPTNYRDRERDYSKHSPSRHPGTSTHRLTGPEDISYKSSVYDQPPVKSSYPTYSHPYSHDISALTNAHRNHVDNSQSYDLNGGRGSETYRKYQDDSSGYTSMPSPKKLSESPISARRGDKSMSRKLNQGSSKWDHENSRERGDDSVDRRRYDSPERRGRSRRSPSPYARSKSPNRGRSERDRSDDRASSNRRRSVEEDYGGVQSKDMSPVRNGRERNELAASSVTDHSWAADSTAPAEYGRATDNREMMSATPNGDSTRRNRVDVSQEDGERRRPTDRPVKNRENHKEGDNDQTHSSYDERHREPSEEKLDLMRQLKEARAERLASEKKREELVKKARAVQAKTNNRRNQAREVWKKKYYEAKKQTPALETDCQRLRAALDSIHKKYLTALENSATNSKQKENYQLEAAKIEYQVDELQRKADGAKMKLTAEMKLRNQAETELRALRAELSQKKMNMSLSRAQKIDSIGNSVLSISSQP